MANIGSSSIFKDEFLLGAAKAFFVTAYADFVEEGHSTDNELSKAEREARLDLPRPGAGEDWMDYAPEPPPAAFALAGELWAALEAANKVSVYVLAERADQADVDHKSKCEKCDREGFDAEEFGHYLAMQAMGHGVSWFDDHGDFDLEVPHIECSQCSFDDAAYGL
jgi:hypothetical protein